MLISQVERTAVRTPKDFREAVSRKASRSASALLAKGGKLDPHGHPTLPHHQL